MVGDGHEIDSIFYALGLPCLVKQHLCKTVDLIERAKTPEVAMAIKQERCYPCFVDQHKDTNFPQYFETDLSPRCEEIYRHAIRKGLWPTRE